MGRSTWGEYLVVVAFLKLLSDVFPMVQEIDFLEKSEVEHPNREQIFSPSPGLTFPQSSGVLEWGGGKEAFLIKLLVLIYPPARCAP